MYVYTNFMASQTIVVKEFNHSQSIQEILKYFTEYLKLVILVALTVHGQKVIWLVSIFC